jgi:hypothetical protein
LLPSVNCPASCQRGDSGGVKLQTPFLFAFSQQVTFSRERDVGFTVFEAGKFAGFGRSTLI